MATKLTQRSVAAFRGNGKKDHVLWDNEVRGFCLKVTKGGRRTFEYKFRTLEGRQRKVKIGNAATMKVEVARKEAISIYNRNVAGESVGAKRTNDILTLSAFCRIFIRDYASIHKKPKSLEDDERFLRLHIEPKLGHIPLEDVGRRDVAQLHRAMHTKPYAANRCVALLSKMFNLAEEWEYRPEGSNPCRHIHKYKEIARERFLSRKELAHLESVIDDAQYKRLVSDSVIHALRLLLMTGCRLREITTAKWEYVHFEIGKMDLPDSKTGKKTVWLSEVAIDYLSNIKRKDGNPYICVGQRRESHLVNIQKPWRKIRKLAKLDDVRIHDLRHTYASMAISQNLSLPIVGALLGHKSSKSTERYAHLYSDVLADAAKLTGRHLEAVKQGGG